MSDTIGLTVYNPGSLTDADFLRGYVARQGVAKELTQGVLAIASGKANNHFLILGQRGMGKTSMLRRLALEVRSDERLSRVLIPLTFREEQYNVHSFPVFWANCLDALGDWFDSIGEHEKAERLDRETDALASGGGAEALFGRWIASEGRRALLLLDNIDLIFAGLKKEPGHLTKFVPQRGGIVIVGASATTVDAICEKNGQLNKVFKVVKLNKLSKEELVACLRSLALARGEDGERVLRLLNTSTARIKTLHDLTGGNPRTLTMLYMLLETDEHGDVFRDLERLLDQATVLYKARVEDLPPQSRVVLDAVALNWDPALAAAVAATTFLDVTTVSSQLDRLQKEGIVERVAVSKTTKAAYQVSERFFNIWYLMRHGARKQRTKLKWLTAFLRSFYSSDQLIERAKKLLNAQGDLGVDAGADAGVDTGHYLLALSDAIDDAGWQSVLASHARDEFERYAETLGLSLKDIVDPGDVPLPADAAGWIRHGNLLRQHLKRPEDAEQAFLKATSLEPENWAAWFNLGATRTELGNPMSAVEALNQSLALNKKHVATQYMIGDAFRMAGEIEAAKSAYKACLSISPNFYLAAIALGDLFSEEGDIRAAASQYELVGRLAPKSDTRALDASAFFVAYILEDFQRALKMYRRLLDISPQDFVTQSNVAVLELMIESPNEIQKPIEESLLQRHPVGGQAIIRAIQAMRIGDRSSALSNVAKIFADDNEKVFELYKGFLLLLLREAHREGWADLLLTMLDETGAADKNWPLRVAYEAYVHGAERLLDVNPEVRASARKILGLLSASGVRHAGEHVVSPKR